MANDKLQRNRYSSGHNVLIAIGKIYLTCGTQRLGAKMPRSISSCFGLYYFGMIESCIADCCILRAY
jgi:hypothetical protein